MPNPLRSCLNTAYGIVLRRKLPSSLEPLSADGAEGVRGLREQIVAELEANGESDAVSGSRRPVR